MVYMRVAHTNDGDEDLFSFSSILSAANYVLDEHISEYEITDYVGQMGIFGNYQPDDFTFIGTR